MPARRSLPSRKARISVGWVDDATIAHCQKYNIPVIHFKNEYGDIDLQAEKLKERLAD